MTVAYCTQNSSSACFHASWSSVLPPTPNQKFCNAHTARSEFDHINKTVTRVFSYTNMYMSLYIQRLQATCMYIHVISFPWKLMKGCWGAAILIRGVSRRERERGERENPWQGALQSAQQLWPCINYSLRLNYQEMGKLMKLPLFSLSLFLVGIPSRSKEGTIRCSSAESQTRWCPPWTGKHSRATRRERASHGGAEKGTRVGPKPATRQTEAGGVANKSINSHFEMQCLA